MCPDNRDEDGETPGPPFTARRITPKGLRFLELLFQGFDEEEASLITWSEFADDGKTPRPQN